jgi:serine/threonine-protein kinase
MEKYCPKCFKKFPVTVEVCPVDNTYLVSPNEKNLVGEVLDNRYTVLEQIGRGGMGVVYRAEQHLIRRVVALKVLRRDVVQDESAVKRFLTEAQAIASLANRHTVTLYDFGVTRDGLLYYTMELLKGQPLSKLIQREAPLDVERSAKLVLQVCESLREAHEHRILHRDLKPDNLFVGEYDGEESVKVVDFGIAKLVGEASTESVTRTGMIVGTPRYLSPEQAMGNPVVPASDLYSLAIVLYEMLAGEPPFIDETPMKTMLAHIRNQVPPLRQTNPNVMVPRSVELFLGRALEKEPERRFRTAIEFRDALKRALADYDDRPEEVALHTLSTNETGLREKSVGWEEQGELQRHTASRTAQGRPVPGSTYAPAGAAAGARVPTPPAGPQEGEVRHTPARQPVTHPKIPLREETSATLAAETPTPAPPRSVTQARPGGGRPAPEEDALEETTGEGDLLKEARRSARMWGGMAAVAVVLVAGLLVWHPWAGPSDGPNEEKKAGQASESGTKGKADEASPGKAADQIEPPATPSEKAEPGMKGQADQAVENAGQPDGEAGEQAKKEAGEQARRTAEEAAAKKADEERAAARKAQEAEAEKKAAEAALAAAQASQQEEAAKAEKARHAAEQAEKKRKEEEARAAEKEKKQAEQAEKKRKEEEARAAEKEKKQAEEAEKKRKEEEARAAEKAREEAEEPERMKKEQAVQAIVDKAKEAYAKAEYDEALALIEQARQQGAEAAAMDRLADFCRRGIRDAEIMGYVDKGNRAFEEKRWNDCVTSLEKAVKMGSTAPGLQERLKKCRAMAAF